MAATADARTAVGAPARSASALKIGEAARTSGVPAATLRYYDQLGLVSPGARSPAGYRLYGERDLERLRFIGRAKELGCSLDEVTQLLAIYDGGTCAPVQDRLRELVADKIAASRRRLLDATILVAELQGAAAELEQRPPSGACDDTCGCVSSPSGARGGGAGMRYAVPVAFGPTATVALGPTATVTCSLETASMPGRLERFEDLVGMVRARSPIDGGVRLTLDPAVEVGDLARLLVAEQQCCPFWSFSLTVDERGLGLEVVAPGEAADLVSAVFGAV